MLSHIRPRTVLGLWVLYWGCLFISTHVPVPRGMPHIRNADKVAHFVAYFGLAALGAWRLLAARPSVSLATLWRWAGVYALFGVADELLQPFVGRTLSFWDWAADVMGVTTATLLVSLLVRKKLSEPAHDRS